MNYNKAFLAFLVFLVLFPISYALADTNFVFEDRMNDGGTLFFLVELEEDDEIEVELEAYEEGYFHLYLFDERPTESHVNYDNTIDSDINKDKVAHDSGKHPDINYTAEDDQIYYLQIILTKNGPDFFRLEANEKLTRYYLPQIPGYELEIILLSIALSLGIMIYVLKKKISIS
ncbi:MAG: hypothetical protein EU535_03835 [Promethearchaeota archaeon]|nr:MAG: hypothetical protein EU535_03835 [Candidatus Lokiarchaeota archaeon]